MKKQPVIRFHITYATHKVVNDATRILLFGKTIDGQKICAVDEYTPYFYVRSEELPEYVIDKIQKLQTKKLRVIQVHEEEARYLGNKEKVYKVYVNDPAAVPIFGRIIRNWEFIADVLETDINVVRKYFMDMDIQPLSQIEITGEASTMKLKVPGVKIKSITQVSDDMLNSFDVLGFEVQTYNPRIRENPILMISFFREGYRKTITWKIFNTEDKTIEFVKSEADLIQRFREVIDQLKPDILAGWGSDAKAMQHLQYRARKYRIRLDLGLDYSELRSVQKNATTSDITGIVHADLKRFWGHKEGKDFTIEDAEKITGAKDLISTQEIGQVWENTPENLERFCTNNIRYAEISYRMCIESLPHLNERVSMTSQQMFAVSRMNPLNMVEWFLIINARREGELIPARPRHAKERHIHAKLYLPKEGIYDEIVVFDLSNLYASVVSSHNISIETIDCECCDGELCTKRKGFISQATENLLSRKRRLVEIMKSNRGVKITARYETIQAIISSLYTYLTFPGSRWYSPRCVEVIANIAKQHIDEIIEKMSENGLNVLYSDGDRMIVEKGEQKVKDIRYVADQLNLNLPGDLEVEYEGAYRRALIPGGRRHALLDPDDNAVIRGFFRRSMSQVSKDILTKVIGSILHGNKPEFQRLVQGLNRRPIKDFIIRSILTRSIKEYDIVLPHVKAAMLLQQEGKVIRPGMTVGYVIVKGTGNLRDRVKLPHDASREEIDTDYYLNNQIIPAVEEIFELIKIDIKESKDKRLESFF